MSDDKTKTGGGDRDRVSASEDYEVEHFAQQNGITKARTLELIKAHGGDRAAMTAAAKG